MSNFVAIDPTLGSPNASATGTDRLANIGDIANFVDNATGSTNMGCGEFIYCRGSNVASRGQFVHVSNGSAVLLASGNSTVFWPIGVAAGVLSATNVFGWVQIQGLCDYATASNTSVAANDYLALGSTAGQVGSVTALGSRIMGLAVPNSFTSSQVSLTVYLHRPQIIGVTASN